MNRLLYVMISLITVFACTNNAGEKSMATLKQFSSPAKDSCAEPFLFTDKNGLVYLSWTEKKGKESSLKFSILKNETWSEPIIIAAGKNWFVNWADYPVLSAGEKAKKVRDGYVLNVANVTETSFQLLDKIDVGGKMTNVTYQFQKN